MTHHSGFEVSHSTLDDTLEDIGLGPLHYKLIAMCASSYFAAGAEFMILAFISLDVQNEFKIDKIQYASIASTAAGVAIFSGFVFGRFADKIGRRLPFLIAQILIVGFGLACACSWSFTSLIVFRSFVAVGLGGLQSIDYIVLLETVPPSKKILAGQLVFFSGCIGLVFLAAANLLIADRAPDPSMRWRYLMGLAALVTLPSLILRFSLKFETPRWLLSVGRVEEMRQILLDLSGQAEIPNLENLRKMIHKKTRTDFSDLFATIFENTTIPICLIWIIQGFVFTGSHLFLKESLQESGVNSDLVYLFLACCEVPGVLISGWLSHRISRSFTLKLFLCLATLSAASASAAAAGDGRSIWISISVCSFYGFLVPCWGVLFLLTPECYPAELKATAVGFASMGKQLACVAGPIAAAKIKDSGPVWSMALWSGGCAVAALIASVWLRIPKAQVW
jgi:MFS transporter, putative metabolite:H+ symporter